MTKPAKELAVNKLIILFIFNEMDFPLLKGQVTDIVLQNNLINYFDLQQSFHELEKLQMIQKVKNKEQYVITSIGQKTITALITRIPKEITELIKIYTAKNKDIIRLETQVFASYIKKSDVEYIVVLKVVENDITLIELKINVVSAIQAKQICAKWKQSYSLVYNQVINTLIK